MFTVTRQHRYYDGCRVVEINYGGLDYANPDTLAPKYEGELQEYDSMREAAEAAIRIADCWQQDSDHPIHLAYGYTWGMTAEFDAMPLNEETKRRLRELAADIDRRVSEEVCE